MSEWIECELAQLLLVTDSWSRPQIIVLREKGGEKSLMMHIGFFEAMAINRQIHDNIPPRPMTHDMALSIIEELAGKLVKVLVSDLCEDNLGNGTFYGFLVIRQGEEEHLIDCRPSDAIAMAVREDCPIFVSASVMSRVATN
ncbi:MAG: bifunctional nuclease family protein [Planctomycetota bacterium]|jgi:bifunctional DNase/RNase|nr:bifunctional nuclease family protein [Planctomycetota bacterium]